MKEKFDIAVIGGGFFGLFIAEYFSKLGKSVILLEKEKEFMTRASYVNQARVHNGYHYPRSVLTALRSRVSFPKFNNEFRDCICDEFVKYYMIGSLMGKVTGKQFKNFCERIDIPCEVASSQVKNLTNPKLIEDVFLAKEFAFDSKKLKEIMLGRLEATSVYLTTNAEVYKISEAKMGGIDVNYYQQEEDFIINARQVYNCTYSQINKVVSNSHMKNIHFKHEMTEMCLVEVPDVLKGVGITIMCGPFFSVMPFPSKGLHSFSHVRYTPHYEWHDSDSAYIDSHQHIANINKKSAWNKMRYDAKRYLPILDSSIYKESLWEVKTILPRSESDDSRPILFKANYGLKGFHCIMGGKIDNVYDVIDVIKNLGLDS
ncbi:FAD-dependent oxidoreductase [Endozoicomonas sp. ALE010]|uniref:FAD-dependent oxidoreductase n=1 Tax=Endozoicomonas sp. ALE010 TaxID=3403081 RepID=UPI003BB4A47C